MVTKWIHLNQNNYTVACSILLKFDTDYNHVIANTLDTLKVKVKGSKANHSLM